MSTTTVSKGSTVEVSSNDPGFHGAWYVASLIDQLPPSPTNELKYLVKYDTLLTDDTPNKPLTEIVSPSCVRPLPPRNLRRNNVKSSAVVVAESSGGGSGGGGADFELYDVVDAYHREGWWIGVVNKVVNGGGLRKYLVSFENPTEEVEFGRGQLRLHVDWVDGRWVVPPKKIPEHVLAARNAKRALESNNDAHPGLETPSNGAQTTDVDDPTVDPLLSSLKKSASKKNTDGSSETVGDVEASVPSRKNKRITSLLEQDSGGKKLQSSAGSKGNTKVKASMTERRISDTNNEDSPVVEHEMITTENCETEDGKSSQKKKRGRQPKLLAKGGPEITVDLDEQPLSQLAGLKRSSCFRPDHGDEPPNQATVTSVGTTDYEKNWPFIKRSPIWATIASLEIYQTPPQQPHFSPLKKIKEDHREGLAIAHMVTFGNLVQTLSDIQLTDPVNVMNNSLEILGDLETHGFNVGALRGRLNKLLSLKSKVSQHGIKLKKAEAELEKRNGEKCVEEKEFKEMEMKMKELQEKMSQSVTRMEVKEKEIMSLKSNLRRVSEQITDCELAFKKLAATPLQGKSPKCQGFGQTIENSLVNRLVETSEVAETS
ncbi:putative Agenet-like domain-containing protein [Helianthus debilis subsp. tardiflorus]